VAVIRAAATTIKTEQKVTLTFEPTTLSTHPALVGPVENFVTAGQGVAGLDRWNAKSRIPEHDLTCIHTPGGVRRSTLSLH